MDNIKTNAFYIQSPLLTGDNTSYITPIRLFYSIYNLWFNTIYAVNSESLHLFKQGGK